MDLETRWGFFNPSNFKILKRVSRTQVNLHDNFKKILFSVKKFHPSCTLKNLKIEKAKFWPFALILEILT